MGRISQIVSRIDDFQSTIAAARRARAADKAAAELSGMAADMKALVARFRW